jgi:hypothetical protein
MKILFVAGGGLERGFESAVVKLVPQPNELFCSEERLVMNVGFHYCLIINTLAAQVENNMVKSCATPSKLVFVLAPLQKD